MSDPAELFCTVHQRIDERGAPMVMGSEVRMPDGTPIPRVESVVLKAEAGAAPMWIATIRVPVLFGEPIFGPLP
jgi:hypothetical protein